MSDLCSRSSDSTIKIRYETTIKKSAIGREKKKNYFFFCFFLIKRWCSVNQNLTKIFIIGDNPTKKNKKKTKNEQTKLSLQRERLRNKTSFQNWNMRSRLESKFS